MKLPELGVKRPVFTFMVFVGILILGIVSYIQLPIDLMPNLEFPTLSVITRYNGASTEDVETRVTKILEERLSTITGLKDILSTSQENLSTITLQFEWGKDLDEAANDVRQMVDFSTRFLPEDAERPMIMKFDPSMMPVIVFGITAEESYPELYDLIDEKFCNDLRKLQGVAMTMIMGGLQREIKVNIDRHRLEAYNLSINQIAGILATENITQTVGGIKVGKTDYVIRVPGEFKDINEINNVLVGLNNGSPVYIKDIATVEDSFKDIEHRTRINKRSGLIVIVQKQSGENTVTVARRIKKALPEIKKNLPVDVEVYLALDSSDFIKRSINNLVSTIGWALLFVILIVFLFIGEFRNSLIVALTIPFSLIIAFIFLFIGGYTINLMTLSAIAIALGMVIDAAIVIFENTYRHYTEEGESKSEASIFGSSEVGLAVTASTITTVAIFVPIMFVKGITGIMFRELAYVVIIVLLASLFSALTFTPMFSSKFMRKPEEQKSRRWLSLKFQNFTRNWFSKLENNYRKVLEFALNHKLAVIIIGLILFVISLSLLKFIHTEFTPAMDESMITGTAELPVGTRIEETDKVMSRIENIMEKDIPERDIMYARCGESTTGMGTMMGQRNDINIIMFGISLIEKNKRNRTSTEITEELRKKISEIPGVAKIDFTQQDMFSSMSGGEKPISIEIYGHDIVKTDAFAAKVKEIMEKIKGLKDISISREKGRPELWIEIDRDKASSLGLNMYNISSTLRTNFYGKVATRFREAGNEYDTFIQLKKADRKTLNDLNNVFVTSALGKQIPLNNFARIVEREGPLTLERKNQERIVRVGASLYKRALGDVTSDIRKELSKTPIPEGVSVKIGGTADDQQEAFTYLFLALILGIILVYMIMAAQFESFLGPFIILFSIPFAIIGVIWALFITGKTLNIMSYVGMVMLVGIVVNNAIVLVDYINILRLRGIKCRDAILITGPRRLRPILMTAFTTIFALLPLVFSTGEGSELWSPLAISVIGGLLFSTIVTLIFVPTLYAVLEEKRKS
ncbi:AcrB/AcrD/AcrF family protein [candidate division KSB1 bacterium]|nr:MAG: AcrB/AcrD/AcrF family protein [candidate division KSB1 bacterium]